MAVADIWLDVRIWLADRYEGIRNWLWTRRAVAQRLYRVWKNRNKISAEEAEVLFPDAEKCVHCGGWHQHTCPRIKHIWFTGETVTEVEFWEDGKWPQDEVVFPWQKAKMIVGDVNALTG